MKRTKNCLSRSYNRNLSGERYLIPHQGVQECERRVQQAKRQGLGTGYQEKGA